MADTETTNYGFTKPEIGSSLWGAKLNTDMDSIDEEIKTVEDAVDTKAASSHTHTESDITDLDHDDFDAVHIDGSNELDTVVALTTIDSLDLFLIEDESDGYDKKKIPFSVIASGVGGGEDATAIHTDESGEISGVNAKITVADADILLIEDSADTYSKKKVTVAALISGASNNDSDAVHVNVADEINQMDFKSPIDLLDIIIAEDSEDSWNKIGIEITEIVDLVEESFSVLVGNTSINSTVSNVTSWGGFSPSPSSVDGEFVKTNLHGKFALVASGTITLSFGGETLGTYSDASGFFHILATSVYDTVVSSGIIHGITMFFDGSSTNETVLAEGNSNNGLQVAFSVEDPNNSLTIITGYQLDMYDD